MGRQKLVSSRCPHRKFRDKLMETGSSSRTGANWTHVWRGDAPSQVCLYPAICLYDWLPEQHLGTISNPNCCVWVKGSGFTWRPFFCFGASLPLVALRLSHNLSFFPSLLLHIWYPFACLIRPALNRQVTQDSVQIKRPAALIIPAAHSAIKPPPQSHFPYHLQRSPLFLRSPDSPFALFTSLSVSLNTFSSRLFTFYPFCFIEDRAKKKSCDPLHSPRKTTRLLERGLTNWPGFYTCFKDEETLYAMYLIFLFI